MARGFPEVNQQGFTETKKLTVGMIQFYGPLDTIFEPLQELCF